MPEDQYFRPRNWGDHQAVKKRGADYVRNKTHLLNSPRYRNLTPNQRAVLHGLWMLCGDTGRALPLDSSFIGARLGLTSQVTGRALKGLLDCNYLEICGKTDTLVQEGVSKGEVKGEGEGETLPKGNDAGASEEDLKARIFNGGLEWLAKHSGKTAKALRPMVGRWCSLHGDGLVLETMINCQRAAPVEPVAYIERLLTSGGVRDGPVAEQKRFEAENQVDDMIAKAAAEADRRKNGNLLPED